MKTSIKFGMAMLAMLALAGCGSKKEAVIAEKSTVTPPIAFKSNVGVPCMESSYDDDIYFRALGTGSSRDRQLVRTLAIRDARRKLNMKIAQEIEAEATYNNADVICEELMMTEAGVYDGYVVLEIAKDSIKYKQP